MIKIEIYVDCSINYSVLDERIISAILNLALVKNSPESSIS